ncbi:phosphotransferase family protein [Kribbella hippodromi]|uniref:phosphotransferase family protein n=1 Tax=Kribbella hippodromi TaxID=434347 RepID=UPI0031D6C2A9
MPHIKRRSPATPGSIPAVLNIFESEVRFYREIAPVVGVRVPACYESEASADGTLLVLEDLSAWAEGAEPDAGARALRDLHDRWSGQAHVRWPWLRPLGAGEDLVAALYDETWPALAERSDLSAPVRDFGARLVGKVAEAERAVDQAGVLTLVHGDASAQNLRTGPNGEVAFLDWEDVSAAPGVLDLAWFLVSSVEPDRWQEALDAYGEVDGLKHVLPSVMVQGYLTMADLPEGEAAGWNARLQAAVEAL